MHGLHKLFFIIFFQIRPWKPHPSCFFEVFPIHLSTLRLRLALIPGPVGPTSRPRWAGTPSYRASRAARRRQLPGNEKLGSKLCSETRRRRRKVGSAGGDLAFRFFLLRRLEWSELGSCRLSGCLLVLLFVQTDFKEFVGAPLPLPEDNFENEFTKL